MEAARGARQQLRGAGRRASILRAMPEVSTGGARFARALLLGSLVSLAVFVGVLGGPGPGFLRDNGLLGSFYDAQAQALLDGHLDVDPARVTFEGFRVDGRTQIYFGIFPSLLRLPFLAVDGELDGRLTQLSMLLAFVVLLAGSGWLLWRVRSLLGGTNAPARWELVTAFLFPLAVGAGAVPLYLAGRAVVYHEAELWGAALSVAALAAVVGVIARPSAGRVVAAAALIALALNARFSVGLGPLMALALVALAMVAASLSGRSPALRRLARLGPREPPRLTGPTALLLVGALLLPLGLHAAVNSARFGTPFGIPIDKQVYSQINPDRRAALEANGGTIFGAQFVPTTLVQALRPDAVGSVRAFPFVALPHAPAKVIGDVRFDTIEPSLSATTSMPALCLLTLAGVVLLVRRREWALAGVFVAAAGGFFLSLTIAFVTSRYLADALPALALGGAIGLQALGLSARARAAALAGLALLVVAGIVVNGGAALVSQRLLDEASEPERAAFVRAQDDVDRLLGRAPAGVRGGPSLPERAQGAPGDLFVVGDCAGLYVQGLQHDWLAVERTAGVGVQRVGVTFPESPPLRDEVLLALGSGPRSVVVTTRSGPGGTSFAVRTGGRPVERSAPIAPPRSRPLELVVSLDFFSGSWFTGIDADGERVLTVPTPDVRGEPVTVGVAAGGAASFSGELERVRSGAPVCRTVAGRAGLLSESEADSGLASRRRAGRRSP